MTLLDILLAYEKAYNEKIHRNYYPLKDTIGKSENEELIKSLMQTVITDFNYSDDEESNGYSSCYKETNFSESFKSNLLDTKFAEALKSRVPPSINKIYQQITHPFINVNHKITTISDSAEGKNNVMNEFKVFVQDAVANDSRVNASKIFQNICNMSNEDVVNPDTVINLNPVIFAIEHKYKNMLLDSSTREKQIILCLKRVATFSPNTNTVKQAQNLLRNFA
jgi:hypothetical protein